MRKYQKSEFSGVLRAIFNSDIFEKYRHPPSVFKIPKLKLGHFQVPPPLLGHCPKFSHFSILTPPLTTPVTMRVWGLLPLTQGTKEEVSVAKKVKESC